MKERRETLKADASDVLKSSAEPKPQAWNPPTLTTWEIKEETLNGGSGTEYK
jgi:hypothetical protein